MVQGSEMIAVCGLDCGQCRILRAGHEPAIARELAERFRANGRADATPEWFHCDGCRGERSRCWSDDCWIRQCCADERGLGHCSECAVFPCTGLQEWAAKNERYGAALERLKGMADGAG